MMHIMNEERVTLSKSASSKAFERGERLLKKTVLHEDCIGQPYRSQLVRTRL